MRKTYGFYIIHHGSTNFRHLLTLANGIYNQFQIVTAILFEIQEKQEKNKMKNGIKCHEMKTIISKVLVFVWVWNLSFSFYFFFFILKHTRSWQQLWTNKKQAREDKIRQEKKNINLINKKVKFKQLYAREENSNKNKATYKGTSLDDNINNKFFFSIFNSYNTFKVQRLGKNR